MNLLLQIYFKELRGEGLSALGSLIARADRTEMTIFAEASRQKLLNLEGKIEFPRSFNLLEAILTVSGTDGSEPRTEVDVRYRPAVGSRSWRRLTVPNPASISSNEHDAESLQLYLSLVGLDRSVGATGTLDAAVLQFLCRSIPALATIGATASEWLERLCPELLKMESWGYADVVPFRQLSIEEEWEIARTSVLWADPAVSADAFHQYLLRTPNAQPNVPVPEVGGVRERSLIVYALSEPR